MTSPRELAHDIFSINAMKEQGQQCTLFAISFSFQDICELFGQRVQLSLKLSGADVELGFYSKMLEWEIDRRRLLV